MQYSFYQKVAFTGLVLFILASFFSVGYHHPDEHFQIIEFCNYKQGNIPATDLSWEFQQQIRPALPVFVCYAIFNFFETIGISNPFVLAFLLRLITAVLAWMVLKRLAFLFLDDFKHEHTKKIFFVLIFLLWFMPYISVRFSSENLAAITFLAALFLVLKPVRSSESKNYLSLFIAGILLAFSFYFRFQMGFAIIGLGGWLLFIRKPGFVNLVFLLAGGILALVLCIASDYWLYGAWVLSPVNYFTANIVENVASGWGDSPWWYYFYMFFLQAIPPIGLTFLIFFGWGFVKKKTHVFAWIMIPFLLAHFFVGHKEMRFLFPMIFPLLYFVAVGIDQLSIPEKRRKTYRILFRTLLGINLFFLFFRTLMPARELLYYHQYLYSLAATNKIELVCLEEDRMYHPAQLPIHFYKSPNVTTLLFADEVAFQAYLDSEKPTQIYLLNQELNMETSYNGYSEKTCFSILPDWVTKLNVNDWTNHAKIWEIKELRRM